MQSKNMNDEAGKKSIGLIFTLDYEIHGNGQGDFSSWAYFPTSHMLDIFDLYGAKLTIMAEMGHYWAMKKYEHLFSNEIHLFESQLKNTIERGHDVQLHIHPQWSEAHFAEGRWRLDFSRNTIKKLCNNYDEAYFYLTKGKNDLENLLSPIDPNYQCKCYRAGYLQMQPSENIIKALEDAGFISDSSVQKGTVVNDSLRLLDYSHAYSRYMPWKVSTREICKKDETGKIIEFPILTERLIIKKTVSRIRRLIFRNRFQGIDKIIPKFLSSYSQVRPSNEKLPVRDKIKTLQAKSWDYVDFCRKDSKYLISAIKKVVSDCNRNESANYVPLVLIGHSKDFFFANHLSLFLEACKAMENVRFDTYYEAVKKYSIDNHEK